jgi:hypothetical protein
MPDVVTYKPHGGVVLGLRAVLMLTFAVAIVGVALGVRGAGRPMLLLGIFALLGGLLLHRKTRKLREAEVTLGADELRYGERRIPYHRIEKIERSWLAPGPPTGRSLLANSWIYRLHTREGEVVEIVGKLYPRDKQFAAELAERTGRPLETSP